MQLWTWRRVSRFLYCVPASLVELSPRCGCLLATVADYHPAGDSVALCHFPHACARLSHVSPGPLHRCCPRPTPPLECPRRHHLHLLWCCPARLVLLLWTVMIYGLVLYASESIISQSWTVMCNKTGGGRGSIFLALSLLLIVAIFARFPPILCLGVKIETLNCSILCLISVLCYILMIYNIKMLLNVQFN